MTTRFPRHLALLISALLLATACADDAERSDGDATDASLDVERDTQPPDVSDHDADTNAQDAADTTAADTTVPDDVEGDADDAETDTADVAEGDAQDAADVEDVALPDCTRSGFVLAAQAAEGEAGFAAWYGATSSTTPTDRATFEVLDLPREPFEFVFTGENYKACDVCLTLGAECDNAACAKTFLALSGTASVTAWGEVGEQLAGTFTDLVAVEVTIGDDFTSTPVADGEVWCIDALPFDATLEPL